MDFNKSKTAIVVAIITTLGAIVVALIQLHPWSNKTKTVRLVSIAGTVIDEDNKNIGQAQITIVGRNEQYYTEQNGNFYITFPDSLYRVRLRVVKANYAIYDKSFSLPDEGVIIQLSNPKSYK